MRLYCYTYFADKIMKEGYLSAAVRPNPCLSIYAAMAGSDDEEEIKKYLEKTFPGRLRSICCLTETAPVEKYEHPYLDCLAHQASIVSFDLDELLANHLVEAIYCKDNSETALTDIEKENICQINDISEIDTTPLNWHACAERYGSPYNMLRHYILVLTKGYIPPEYITLERYIELEK